MPRKKRPACGMEEACGGTPVFGVAPWTCWSLRKTPAQSASVSDDRAKKHECAGRLMHLHAPKVMPKMCAEGRYGVCVWGHVEGVGRGVNLCV